MSEPLNQNLYTLSMGFLTDPKGEQSIMHWHQNTRNPLLLANLQGYFCVFQGTDNGGTDPHDIQTFILLPRNSNEHAQVKV